MDQKTKDTLESPKLVDEFLAKSDDKQIKRIANKIADILEERQNKCSARHKGKNDIYFSGGLGDSEEKIENPQKDTFFDERTRTIYIPFDGGWIYARQSPDTNYPGIFVGVKYDDLKTSDGSDILETEVVLVEVVTEPDVKLKPEGISSTNGDIRTLIYDYVGDEGNIDVPDLGGYTRKKDID